jgi:hypothetical protein
MALEAKRVHGVPVGSTAALHYIFAEADGAETANAFFMDWINETGKPGSPTRVLAKRLQDLMIATNNRIHESVRNALIIQAYTAYRDKRALKAGDLRYDPGEDAFPAIVAPPEPAPATAPKPTRSRKAA